MDLGSGIATAGVCISGGAVIITAIRVFAKDKNSNNPVCKHHSGIVACLEKIEDGLSRHEKWLLSISNDIKELLSRR